MLRSTMAESSSANPSHLETIQLIGLHRDGDRAALDELFKRYEDRVRRIVRVRMGAFLRSRAEVEDVVQETLLAAFKDLDGYEHREGARLIDWMARIAENKLRNLCEHEHAQKRDPGREVPIEKLRNKDQQSSMGWDPASPSAPPPGRLAAKEVAEIIDRCLTELPEREREVILLVDYAREETVGKMDDVDWEYVTQRTGRPTVAAAQQLHRRARVSLAARVARRLPE